MNGIELVLLVITGMVLLALVIVIYVCHLVKQILAYTRMLEEEVVRLRAKGEKR